MKAEIKEGVLIITPKDNKEDLLLNSWYVNNNKKIIREKMKFNRNT